MRFDSHSTGGNIIMEIQYVTVIQPVLEVTLWGNANVEAWQSMLKDEGLVPYVEAGKAEFLLSAVSSKYMGMPFREFSISVRLENGDYFLIHAFNNLRFFAFAERRFFQTPYYPAKLTVTPTEVGVQRRGKLVFHAGLAPNLKPLRSGMEDAQLKIRLPKKLRKNPAVPHFFYARLRGETSSFPATMADFSIAPGEDDSVFRLLRDAQFKVQEWCFRAAGIHSKSKTFNETLEG